MSFLGGIFGSGGKETKTTTTNITETKDERVQIGGSAGTVVSPGAAVGGAAAVTAAPYANVSQTITSTGIKPAEVQQMLDSMFTAEAGDRQAMTDLAGSLGSGLQSIGQSLTDTLGATRAPEQSALSSLLPLVLLVVILAFASRS